MSKGFYCSCADETTMYDSLNSGSIDALMDDEAVLLYAIQQRRNFTTPIEGIATGEVGFAVKKGTNPELIEMFNNGLAAIVKDGTYDKIINKYLDNNKSKEGSSKKATDRATIIWKAI